MSEVHKSRMRPRLAQLMAEKGGLYVGEALKRADAALEVLREPSLQGIDGHIVALDALLAAGTDAAALTKGLYDRAADIISLSGAERNAAVEVAARSLCELLDELPDRAGVLSPSTLAAFQVHVASIKLLHRTPADPAVQGPILQGLASLLDKQRGGVPAND
ncbi:hypothetical protein [Caulobacter sp. LARHSG274]